MVHRYDVKILVFPPNVMLASTYVNDMRFDLRAARQSKRPWILPPRCLPSVPGTQLWYGLPSASVNV